MKDGKASEFLMDLSAYLGVGVERTLTTDLSHSLVKKIENMVPCQIYFGG